MGAKEIIIGKRFPTYCSIVFFLLQFALQACNRLVRYSMHWCGGLFFFYCVDTTATL